MFKPIKHVLTNSYAELFIQYGQIFNVAIGLWYNCNSLNLLGASLVAVTSFSMFALILSSDIIGNSMFAFLNQVAFQAKSLLFVFAYLGTMFGHISLLYHFFFFTFTLFILIQHNSQFKVDGKTLAGILTGVYCFQYYLKIDILSFIIYILLLCLTLIFYTFPIFYLTENETLLIPIILDVTAVIYYIPTIEMKIFLGVISYLMVIVIYVKPMYNYNVVLLYVLSFVQMYVLCQV
jgi:hypothetical protein